MNDYSVPAETAIIGCPDMTIPSPEVKVFLLAHIAAVTALQSMKDDRGQDGEPAKDKKRLMEAVNHLVWV
jgi:hypothetical protein